MKRKSIPAILLSAAFLFTYCGSDDNGNSQDPGGGVGGKFSVGGTVSGLSGTMVLQNNGGDDITLTSNGTYRFDTALSTGATYYVTVKSAPGGQTCFVANNDGIVANVDISNVNVTCTSSFFTLSGTVRYDYIEATATGLDYGGETQRPARRVTVQAIEGTTPVAETTADDLGAYSLQVPNGKSVKVRMVAKLRHVAYSPDATAPNNCNGSNWNVRVVDNTNGKALYAYDDATTHTTTATENPIADTSDASGSAYTARNGATFAMLDTIVSEIELVCQGAAAIDFPLLYVNWSVNNEDNPGDKTTGLISTSHYTTESGVGNLYILGKEGEDTDEYDDHIIAHEFGHYLEDKLFRSDSIGGTHQLSDFLDTRLAFGEGYGNAISAMTFNDPLYYDTGGTNQGSISNSINIGTAPTGDEQGIFSEIAVQHFLYTLYTNNSNSFDKIYNVFANFQKTTPAFTTAQSFASYYNQLYSTGQSMHTLWANIAAVNSLCSGTCSGGETADPFDLDNDLGSKYNTATIDYAGTGTQAADWWRLYTTVGSGTTAVSQPFIAGSGGSHAGEPQNKYGYNRFFRYVAGTSGVRTISMQNISGGCGNDLDLYVRSNGALVLSKATNSGCESGSVSMTAGSTYVIHVQAFAAVTSYELVINP